MLQNISKIYEWLLIIDIDKCINCALPNWLVNIYKFLNIWRLEYERELVYS